MRHVELGMATLTITSVLWAWIHHRVTDRRRRSSKTGASEHP